MSSRWIANKFGLFNFWYYDDQEYKLANGKVIFRGTNGSGKSVTTQSFIPLLLDGDKSPNRIDPFGTKSRRIENYMLMDEDEEDRISYLYMEFKKPESKTYITIGMGLRARKGKKLESWYFILKDGRRINKDLYLYEFSGEKVPLTQKKFENKLGDGNVFTTGQREYMSKVNEHLFGYSDVENYKELLNLLIELRSPKLSKDFKPTKIYGILNKSLSTLSDDDLRDIAEAMDNMDTLNNKLEELDKSLKSAKKMNNAFSNYNKSVIYKKSVDYNKYRLKVKSEDDNIKKLYKDNNEAEKSKEASEEELKKLKLILDDAIVKRKALENHEGFKINEELLRLEKENSEITNSLLGKKESEQDKFHKIRNNKEKIEGKDLEKYKLGKEIEGLLEDEEYYREQSYYESGVSIKKEINLGEECGFDLILENADLYQKLIENVYRLIIRLGETKKDLDKVALDESEQVRKVNELKRKLEEAIELLTTSKIEYIEKINIYLEQCTELKINDEVLNELFRTIHKINEVYEANNIAFTIKSIAEEKLTKLKEENIELKAKDKSKGNEIKELEHKITNIENNEEYIEEEKNISFIKDLLDKNKIPYLEFYKCYSFNEEVNDENKVILEGALYEMGIAKSLIVPSLYKQVTKEALKDESYKILFGNHKACKNNIEMYFDLEKCEFNSKYLTDVKGVLASIGVKEDLHNLAIINNDFTYKIGVIDGGSNKYYKLKYIGVESRRRYRDYQKELIMEEINNLEKEKSLIIKSIEYVELAISKMNNEIISFPNVQDIETSINLIVDAERSFKYEEDLLRSKRVELFKIENTKKELETKVIEEGEYIKIPKNVQDFEEALGSIRNYIKVVNKIQGSHKDKVHILREMKNIEDNIEDLNIDIDKIISEIYEQSEKLEKIKGEIKSLEEALKTLNLGEVEEELRRVIVITKNYPEQIDVVKEENMKSKNNIEFIEGEVIKSKEKLEKVKNIFEYYKNILNDELSLGYLEEIRELGEEEAVELVLKSYEVDLIERREYILAKLFRTIAECNSELFEYNLRNDEIFGDYTKTEDLEINEVLSSGKRMDITFKINRRSIKLIDLINHLINSIDEQKLLISDKEREIFEDTLINTLSSKISAKIYNANKWVKQINTLMSTMDTSNGLKLDLKWIPKKSENIGEIGSRELTKILANPQFMDDTEREKLSTHFKESLKKAKRLANDEDITQSYQAIIKDVLDYREWYEFRLSYSNNKNTKLNELTDNEFFKLSGGEKAMAMYIPLFAAINARYNAADKKDCPRIIALDEAFAGIDDQNINIMFTLLEGLDLDYVLNSQVLWGTYESVKSLAIYELIRQGDDIVLPIRYSWDGKTRNMEGIE